MEKIKIVLVDDHAIFLDGLQLLLKSNEKIEILEAINESNEVMSFLQNSSCTLVFLDINMPKLNGIDLLVSIKKFNKDIKVIMLSTYNDKNIINKCKSSGADGYLLKTVNKEELFEAIHSVIDNKLFFKEQKEEAKNSDLDIDFLNLNALTKREKEILHLIKEGLTNQQIADTLFLSLYTIETHRKNIKQKLGVKNTVEMLNKL